MTTTFYVKASITPDGNFADCKYYTNYEASPEDEIPGSKLVISRGSGGCVIAKAKGSDLVLVAATFKTLTQAPFMNAKNFSPADDEYAVEIPMPTDQVVTKGVVLLFSEPQSVNALYPSADPEVVNGLGED